jgi:hypothetical protein
VVLHRFVGHAEHVIDRIEMIQTSSWEQGKRSEGHRQRGHRVVPADGNYNPADQGMSTVTKPEDLIV